MKQRIKASRRLTKRPRGKIAKGGSVPSTARRHRSADVGLQEQLDEVRRELREAREQQAATSKVLQVISSTPGALEPVFEAILAKATKICHAKFGALWLYEAGGFRCVALHNAPAAYANHYRAEPLIRPIKGSGLYRLAETRKVQQVADIRTLKLFDERDPFVITGPELGGFRTVLNVPMLKTGDLIGAISIYRQQVRPFTDRQIELVQSFAAQAVIAVENARLLDELRQRTGDLSESLEQQTATTEVLQVISSSPGELKLVFDSILTNATRICAASFGNLLLYENGTLMRVAVHNAPPAWAGDPESLRPLAVTAIPYRVVRTGQMVHIVDVAAEYPDELITRLAGARTLLIVPMLK
jgi:GAF domain-containing protein